MKISDSIKMKGTVEYKVIDNATGRVIDHVKVNNLIVNTGKGRVCHLLAGDTSGNFVANIGAGTNGTATALTDTALTGSASVAIGTVAYPTATSVRWSWTFGLGDANGITIRELGLITGSGTLFSRVIVPAIVKTAAISVIGTWRIDL